MLPLDSSRGKAWSERAEKWASLNTGCQEQIGIASIESNLTV